jgi:putative tricarboxylic transport membrane protein
MDPTTLTIFLLGCLAGVVTGIMPGIGPAHLLAILYTWLVGWNPLHLMIFYIAYITVANFIDAIPSLYFGVPGEVSAIPASRESGYLSQQGLTAQTLKQAAIGRFIGSLIALGLSVYVVTWLLGFPEIFSSRWQISFYIFTIVCICLAGKNPWWANLLYMLAGLAVSFIGYNYYTQQTYGTFEWSELYSGIPLLPVLIGIYVIPQLIHQSAKTQVNIVTTQTQSPGSKYVPSMLRGTAVGYVLGLVPGMSFILGSTAAYTLERWWQKRYPSDRNASVASVVASETASNTGSVSMLIPFLLFGIPIIASEAIIYDLMIDSGAVFTLGSFLKHNYVTLVDWFVAACVLGLLMSWPLAHWFRTVSQKLLDPRFSWILLVLIIVSLAVEAVHQQKIMLYCVALIPSLIVGWLLRKQDVMPFVFVFVLGPNIQSVIYNIKQLYF